MIGLFDSGVGGLSVLKAIVENKIREDFIYFGDTKNVPYGTKSHEEILTYTKDIMEFFVEKGAKVAVMACNTSSALVYEDLKRIFENRIKILPLIQTVAPYFADLEGTIGVVATCATVKSGAYKKEILRINKNAKVFELEAQEFVKIVENRLYDDTDALNYIKQKAEILNKEGCKNVILGCTHFPYLIPYLKHFAPKINFIDPAKYLVQAVKAAVQEKETSSFKFYVSSSPEMFKKASRLFFEFEGEAEIVEFAKV